MHPMKTLTQAQAAELLGVSRQAIAKMIQRGALTRGKRIVDAVIVDDKLYAEQKRRR